MAALLRVKRKREDPSPTDLRAVIDLGFVLTLTAFELAAAVQLLRVSQWSGPDPVLQKRSRLCK